MEQPLSCPFCGAIPSVFPISPINDGNAWGQVGCVNPECSAKPHVNDGEEISDERGSDVYKEIAIKRWNTRY
uniref:Putative restriction alleviation protein n=1 Tax=viral metagenome TaxID=1070528 RepID=A0A6H1ZSP7_9ZZZZ